MGPICLNGFEEGRRAVFLCQSGFVTDSELFKDSSIGLARRIGMYILEKTQLRMPHNATEYFRILNHSHMHTVTQLFQVRDDPFLPEPPSYECRTARARLYLQPLSLPQMTATPDPEGNVHSFWYYFRKRLSGTVGTPSEALSKCASPNPLIPHQPSSTLVNPTRPRLPYTRIVHRAAPHRNHSVFPMSREMRH